MTPKHWKQKNLWRVSLDDLEKLADTLGCSKWEIPRVEIAGRLFTHAIPNRDRKAPRYRRGIPRWPITRVTA